MSGPIVRKYGFPNFEKIFGERPLEHGVDDNPQPAEGIGSESEPKAEKKTTTKDKSKRQSS
jgi:hypothetical protein